MWVQSEDEWQDLLPTRWHNDTDLDRHGGQTKTWEHQFPAQSHQALGVSHDLLMVHLHDKRVRRLGHAKSLIRPPPDRRLGRQHNGTPLPNDCQRRSRKSSGDFPMLLWNVGRPQTYRSYVRCAQVCALPLFHIVCNDVVGLFELHGIARYKRQGPKGNNLGHPASLATFLVHFRCNKRCCLLDNAHVANRPQNAIILLLQAWLQYTHRRHDVREGRNRNGVKSQQNWDNTLR